MKKYTITYRNHIAAYCFAVIEASCNTDARFIARDFIRKHPYSCAYSLQDFWGEYIEI